MAFGISAATWLTAGVGALGAYSAKKGNDKAVSAQVQSGREANDVALIAQREAAAQQQRQYDQARADNEPWRMQGADALNKLAGAPDFAFTGANLASEPGYQFGLNEGNRALTNSAAARGGLLSGAALKASTRYAQDYAGSKFAESFGRALQTDTVNKNRLQSLAGVGQTAVNQNNAMGMAMGQQLGANAMNTAQQIGGNLTGMGNARASGYLANSNLLQNTVNQGLSAWKNYNALATPGIGSGGGTAPTGTYFDGYGYMPIGG